MIDRKLKLDELKPNNVTPISVEMVSVPNAANAMAAWGNFPLNEFLIEEKGRLKVWFGLDVNDLRNIAHVKLKALHGKEHPIFRGYVDPLDFLNMVIVSYRDFPLFNSGNIKLVQDIAYVLAYTAYRRRWNEQFYLDNKQRIDAYETERVTLANDRVYSHHDGYVGD